MRVGPLHVDLLEHRKRHAEVLFAEPADLRRIARLLLAELVAGKAEDLESARGKALVQLLQPRVLRREPALAGPGCVMAGPLGPLSACFAHAPQIDNEFRGLSAQIGFITFCLHQNLNELHSSGRLSEPPNIHLFLRSRGMNEAPTDEGQVIFNLDSDEIFETALATQERSIIANT